MDGRLAAGDGLQLVQDVAGEPGAVLASKGPRGRRHGATTVRHGEIWGRALVRYLMGFFHGIFSWDFFIIFLCWHSWDLNGFYVTLWDLIYLCWHIYVFHAIEWDFFMGFTVHLNQYSYGKSMKTAIYLFIVELAIYIYIYGDFP